MDTIEQTTTQLITPYLTVNGAADAIAFYQKAFGATEMTRMPAQDGKRVMHACLAIKGGAVMLADEFPECADQGTSRRRSRSRLPVPGRPTSMPRSSVPPTPAAQPPWRRTMRSGARVLRC